MGGGWGGESVSVDEALERKAYHSPPVTNEWRYNCT
jgi:hypothetical protein